MPIWAQKDKGRPVSARIEVLMEGAYSKAAIEKQAVQAAKVQAIGTEFGYAIIQGINTQTNSESGDNVFTSTRITEVSSTLVKGEWVSDDKGYPKLNYSIREKNGTQEIWLTCEVRGRARELQQAEADFVAYPFNCQEPEKCKDGVFKNEDSMFLYFKTPVSGYLSVFLLEQGTVYRLLPYALMQGEYESTVPVQSDQEYRLFSPEHREYFKDFPLVDEYGLETGDDGAPLSNFLYVIFSTQAFKKPQMEEANGLKYMDVDDFQKWLNKNRSLHPDFQVQMLNIVVNP